MIRVDSIINDLIMKLSEAEMKLLIASTNKKKK